MNKSAFYMLLIIISVLFVAIVLLQNVHNIPKNKRIIDFPGTQSDLVKRDCDVETIYSVDDAQCQALCKEPGAFVSVNGACVNTLAFNQEVIHANCDPHKGVLAYLLGDPQFGNTKLFCLSIDLGVQPDNVNKENTICTGGSIDIDYVQSFPQLAQCKCPDNKVLAVIPSTTTIRSRGVCMHENYKQFLEFNNAIRL